MISSPCKNCSKKDLPKEDCIKDCELIRVIQEIQGSNTIGDSLSGIDYTEENRYTISLSLPKTSDSLWAT